MSPRAARSLLLVVLAGCGALPDLSGFSRATGELYATTHYAGSVFDAELAGLQLGTFSVPSTPGGLKLTGSLQDVFKELWKTRERSMLVMARYVDALNEIAGAPGTGAEKAVKLSSAVAGVFGGAGLAAVVGGVAEKIVEMALRARARKSMREVVGDLDPLIQEFARILIHDFKELQELLKDVPGELDRLKNAELKATLDRLVEAQRELAKLKISALENLTADQAAKGAFLQGEIARLKAVEAASPHEKAKRVVERHLAALSSVEKVIAAWAAEHARLDAALAEGAAFNPRELLALVFDMKLAYEELRK